MSSSRVPSLSPSMSASPSGARAPGGAEAGKRPPAKTDPALLGPQKSCGSTTAADTSTAELPTEMSSAILPDEADDAGTAAAVRLPEQGQGAQQLPVPVNLDGLRTRSYSTGGVDMDDSDDDDNNDSDGTGESAQRSVRAVAVQPAPLPIVQKGMDEEEDDVESMYEDDDENETDDEFDYDPDFLEAFHRDQARIAEKERETQRLLQEVNELNEHLAVSEQLLLNLRRKNKEAGNTKNN